MQKKIKLKPYECTILFVITTRFLKDAKKHEKTLGLDHDPDINDGDEGVVMSNKGSFVVILNANKLTHNSIAHELFHLTHSIGDDCGLSNDEESMAWICGYVTEEFYKLKDKWILKLDTSPVPASSPLSSTTSPTTTEKSS